MGPPRPMRDTPGRATLAAMTKQRVNLDATLDRAVIRGTLTAHTGDRREFHGWLELNTALEAMLSTRCRPRADHLPPSPIDNPEVGAT
jgi:hypothetical protein